MPAVERTNDPSLVIPPPRADRPPMHANLLNAMQKANTTLTPLFPYAHAGAIVPTGSLFIGGPDKDYGQFYHHNSVDEVICGFVTDHATLATGQVYAGGRVHGVNSFLKDQTKAGSFALFSVTQRQLEEGLQPEAVSVICKHCRAEIFKCEYDGSSPPNAREIDHPFASNAKLPPLFLEFNADPERRKCTACGKDNPPFPVDAWGWEYYATQSTAMASAKRVLLQAGGGA